MVSEPGVDGVFVIVDSIIREIHRLHPEISVDLAYSSRRTSPGLHRLIADIEARGDETMDLAVGNAPGPGDARAILRLIAFARRRGRQLVHGHSSKAGALVRLARWTGCFPPVLYTPHAYYGLPGLGTPKEKLFNAIETVLGRTGQTICNSEDERDFATRTLHIPERYLTVIHNGIDTERFAPADAEEKAEARASLGLPATGKLLITIGRDSLQKNYAPLYAMLDDLLPAGGWAFAHAGAGSVALGAGLRPDAAAHCFNFDHLDDVAPLLRAADGFIMTSRYEGLSLAMLSGLSCGLPMLLTESPGFLFLKDYPFADITWLPDPHHAGLVEALKSAASRWALESRAPIRGQHEQVCKHFCERRQIGKIISVYLGQARSA